tara:strand:- start:211 stop:699 length:489 start_codon:yes stop_codon:yes gene_type:complete
VSSRIELTLIPSHAVGLLCALPWLALTLFLVAVASEFGSLILTLVVPSLVGAAFQYRRTGLLAGPAAVTGLRVESEQLYARLRSGQDRAVMVAGESRLGAHFAILKLRYSGTISCTYPVVLVAVTPRFRNIPPDAFRRLRVWLRLGPASGGKASGRQTQEIH